MLNGSTQSNNVKIQESSLVLSSSSSGESLLSCGDIMLDHLDPHHERIMGELTSDSAISDMSSHKPSTKVGDQIHKFSDTKRTVLEETSKTQERLRSPAEVRSPAAVRTIRHPKSPRKTSNTRLTTSTTPAISSRPTRHPSGDTSIPRIASNAYKSPTSGSSIPIKNRTTPEKRPPTTAATKITKAKPLATATSLSPASKSSTAKKDQVTGLTIENVNKLHKQLELVNSEHNSVEVDHTSCLPVPFVEELMSEFEELRVKLGQLQLQLETQEKRESEKDELIQRLTGEVERLKSAVGDENIHKSLLNGTVFSMKNNDAVDGLAPKDLYLNNLNYENAAVQTENNNIFNRVVTYPEEEDKYGELVRIGRSSSVKKKL